MSLLPLLDPFEGCIKIDGIDIASLTQDLVQSRIVGVAEEPFFFPGTVRLNLDSAGNSTDGQIIQTLAETKLWSIFESHGLDVVLDMEKLSRGQRQLFSIARALLRNAKIYIFDEVTSRYLYPLKHLNATNPLSITYTSELTRLLTEQLRCQNRCHDKFPHKNASKALHSNLRCAQNECRARVPEGCRDGSRTSCRI